MKKYGAWEAIEPPLGKGGQSVVYLARTPKRVAERDNCFKTLKELSGQGLHNPAVAERFARASFELARPELHEELGALKVFAVRDGGAPAADRFKREVAILREKRPNLPRLLDANDTEQWMVTEVFRGGTLDKSPNRYAGRPVLALRAFRNLVQTIATTLHKDGIVHRDIKPANIFIADDGSLIPGDFGIAYLPQLADRPTLTDERVGPWQFMPPWADSDARLEEVAPNFDVYMLGKLLWCMVSGRARLPREFHRWAEHDLEKQFPGDKYMPVINSILDKCLVDRPEACLPSADALLKIIDENLNTIDHGVPLRNAIGEPILPCRVCGKGFYQVHLPDIRLNEVVGADNRRLSPIHLRVLVCSVCTHYAFFAAGNPDEAAARGWTPLSPEKC